MFDDKSTSSERVPSTRTAPSRAVFSRWDLLVALLACAATVGGYMYLSSNSSPPPAKTSEVASPSVNARATVVSVRVHPVKANGRRWDVGLQGLPDLRVMVVNETRGKSRWTTQVNDSLTATFNEATVMVSPGDRLRVRVEDVDAAFHDLVGEHTFTVTKEMIAEDGVELSFGQVESLKLVFLIEA